MALDLSTSPYYDDYDENKQFHRLLFRPSRAVQARELTQMQTILQNQISRFGQNIFVDGSVVVPGGTSIDLQYEYVKLTQTDISSAVVGDTLTGQTSGVVATLKQKVEVDGGDPATFYMSYISSGTSSGRFTDGEDIVVSGTGSGTFTAAGSAATGQGTKIDLDKGVYFVKGYFAIATTQSLIIGKYAVPTGTMHVGLISTESIVTSTGDTSLLDNAAGSSNATAPGADRLKLAMSLIAKDDALSTDDYFTVATIRDGVIVEKFERTTYNLLGSEMARRTYDESGDYTVNPFMTSANAHATDANKLTMLVDSGRAYVKGYLVEKAISTEVHVDKALTTAIKANGKISTSFGNYVRVNAPTRLDALNISTFQKVYLYDNTGTEVLVGSARVRAVTKEAGGKYRIYLFEVVMTSGGFNGVRKISDHATVHDSGTFQAVLIDDADAVFTTDTAALKDTANNNLFFAVPFQRIKEMTDITARVQRRSTDTTDGSGNVTLDTGDSNITWEDTSNWIVVKNDGTISSPSYGSTGAQTIAVSGLDATSTYTFISYVDKTSATTNARAKTLTTSTDLVLTPEGDDSVELTKFDIFEVTAVKDVDNSDADITNRYTLDNGQRDNFYQEGKLTLNTGETAPTGNVKVTFKHFTHGASGAYFNVDSYDGLVAGSYDYGDIPKYTLSSGTEIRLADYYDFRPRKDNTNANFSGTGAVVNELPKINETIQADIEYYLPRIDIIYVDSNGTFSTVTGNPSLTPKAGPLPSNAMAMYYMYLNAGTFDETDISLAFVENRRYTMRDIGEIEGRIERLEEYTTLSLLEAKTESLEVLDSSGNNRFKAGFFVDNFQTHFYADTDHIEYRASIDPEVGLMRPRFSEKNSRMVYRATASDSSTSADVVRKGDFLLLAYTEVDEIEQPLASSSINVNPYNVITNTGSIQLSPATDEWRDVETTTTRVTVQDTRVTNPVQVNNFNNWTTNWAGTPIIPSRRNPGTWGEGIGNNPLRELL